MSFQNNSFPPAFCRISYENARHILSGDMVLHTVRNPHFYSRFMIQRIEFEHIIITYDLLFQFRAVFQHQFHIAVIHLCKDNRRRHSFSEIPPLTSLTRLPILPWRYMVVSLEAPDKRFRIFISHSLTDIRNAHLCVGQHVFPVLQANARQQLRKGHACDSDNPSGAVRFGKMKQIGRASCRERV